METEIRSMNQQITTNGRTIEGYAIVFNSESRDFGGYTEVIDPSAINDEVLRNSEVLALLDHNKDRGILARSRNGVGSLTLSIDEKGLKYSFEAPNTQLGDELLEGIKRGDITTSSFSFTMDEYHWEERGDHAVRVVTKINNLYDVSPVYIEAYPDTTVGKRAYEEYIKNKDKEICLYIEDYYANKLKEII